MINLPVSVVIPTHGRPEFLPEAIDSVLGQTSPPLEIIVVSDESGEAVERARQVVDAYSTERIPVRMLNNASHPGASGSRNLGASASAGDWIAFLDDDDLWTPSFLGHSWAVATATAKDMVVSWVEMFRGEHRGPGVNIQPDLIAREAAARTPGLTGSNFIITKSAFERTGGFDIGLPVMNDIDFMYRYLSSGGQYAVNPNMDLLQRRHGSGQLTRATTMRADGIRKYMDKHRATLRTSDLRHLRLVEYRTRYRAETRKPRKLGYLVLGALNASLSDVALSLRNWRKRGLWHEGRK